MTSATLTLPRPNTRTLLRRFRVGVARADVVFAFLPQNFRNLVYSVAESANTNATFSLAHVLVQCNGDTSAVYHQQEISGAAGGPPVGVENVGATSAIIGWTGTAADPTVPGLTEGFIANYASKDYAKVFQGALYALAPSAPFSTSISLQAVWAPTVQQAIHTLRFFPQAGLWAPGTEFLILGEP